MPMTSRIWPTQSDEPRDALVGDLDAGERDACTRSPPPMFVPSGIESAPGTSLQQADAEVLLQERDAPVHPLLEQLCPARPACRARSCRRRAGRGRGTCRRASASTGTPHALPARSISAISMPHTPPACRAVRAELLDLAEDLVDVAGVLAEDAALEHQRVGLAGAVAHLAPADDPLVGVDADERAGHRRADRPPRRAGR